MMNIFTMICSGVRLLLREKLELNPPGIDRKIKCLYFLYKRILTVNRTNVILNFTYSSVLFLVFYIANNNLLTTVSKTQNFIIFKGI